MHALGQRHRRIQKSDMERAWFFSGSIEIQSENKPECGVVVVVAVAVAVAVAVVVVVVVVAGGDGDVAAMVSCKLRSEKKEKKVKQEDATCNRQINTSFYINMEFYIGF